MTGEFAALRALVAGLPGPPEGETWIGDDTAVLSSEPRGWQLLAVDAVVVGVHADLSHTGLDDLGWKAVVANVSDVAAMGGRPRHVVVSVAGPAGTDLEALYRGIAEAASVYHCPVVGGDLANAPVLVVSVAITGSVEGRPVLRSGARPGDAIWVTGALGAAAAGLRLYRQPAQAQGGTQALTEPEEEQAMRLRRAHARPDAAVAEGTAARLGGATAMIDVSDGFAADLGHVADASGVGFELDQLPIAGGATRAEALGGGEDYVLVFCAPDDEVVRKSFAGLAPPHRLGVCIGDTSRRVLDGQGLIAAGWEHSWRRPADP